MSEPFVSNVISQKYDTALDFHVTMYDNLPYQRDSDYCNIEKVAMTSGRVIKFYLYMNQPEPAIINNKDDEMEQYLLELQLKQQRHAAMASSTPAPEISQDEVTDEQIQTLLDDTSSEDFEENDEIDLENTTNPFADVEDW